MTTKEARLFRRVTGSLYIIFLVAAGLVYVKYTWDKFQQDRANEVLDIARSTVASFPKEYLVVMEAVPEDADKPEYIKIKNALASIVEVNEKVRFAYFYRYRDGKLFFLADSEPEGSEDYSPPGQQYEEADEQDLRPFIDGKELVTSPLTDRWGTWVTVYIPLYNPSKGEVCSVFGMDFDAKYWNKQQIIEVSQSGLVFFLLLFSGFFLLKFVRKTNMLRHENNLRRRVERDLIKAKQEAEMANKAKSVFLSNMSHEIRTPLNAIIGFSQLMSRDKQLSNLQKEYNDSIVRAGEHLLELINEILELSKIEAGRIEINSATIDLYILLNDINLLFSERARHKNLQLIFEKADDLPQYVVVDEGKLRQLFVNIVGNAVKFTEEGGIAVRTRVSEKQDGRRTLVVEVQDSGPGISDDEMGRLFKHFEQTSSGIKKGFGSGLGLALSKELAKIMGGDITVTSELGVGSVFTFEVEISNGKQEDVERQNTNKVIGIKSVKSQEKKLKILVVDDKAENLQVAVHLLKAVGFETIEAVDGADAIEKFKKYNPHLILMDMRMPVMDGYEATQRIKETKDGCNIPIVALTASTFEEERKRIAALKMEGYIRKPFRETELFNTIGKILDIEYIYEEESYTEELNKPVSEMQLEVSLSKLSARNREALLNSVAVADHDQLIEIIEQIALEDADLGRELMSMARNFEYQNIENLINSNK